MLDLRYNYYNFAEIVDQHSFFRGSLKEISKIRSMVDSIKMLFHIPNNTIKLYAAEGERVYKIEFKLNSLQKLPTGWFVYQPLLGRLDLFDVETSTNIPLIQWKGKKVVFSSYSELFNRIKVETLFSKIINVS